MESLFISVINMSLTASYVVAAIMLARLFLKKAPKAISYGLWAVAGFRFLFPFSLESVFSLIPFKSAPFPADIALQPLPQVDSGINSLDQAVSQVLPAATPAASVNPLQIWLTIGTSLWLTGLVVMLIYSLVSITLLKRRLKGAVLIEDIIFEAGNLKTPFVLGLLKPQIFLPSGLSAEEKSYIILHEQTHIRRHDHIVKYFAYCILCLHWFNPLAWVALLLMSADMEMSCDERVLKELGAETKKAYSLSLLSLATERRIIGGSPLAFGEGSMKERIKNVLNFRKPSQVVITATVALVVMLSPGFALNKSNNGIVDLDLQSYPHPAESRELIAKVDLNRDDRKEGIYLDQSQQDNNFVILRVLDDSGKEIWSELASTAHAGWTSLFLCEQDGKYYLLRYLPGMWQGYCSYTYTLFTLEGGAEKVIRSNAIEFDINGVNPLDAPQMIAFADEVNGLLNQSTLLLSSQGGKYSFGPPSAGPFLERYSWLDRTPELYSANDDLKTRLAKYSEYAITNHRRSLNKLSPY